MTRLFHLSALGMALCALLSSCKKSLSSLSLPKDSATQIAEARSWFQHSVGQQVTQPAGPGNPRNHSPKSPVWDQARALELSDPSGVIVPLHYKAPLYIMNHASGSPLFAIDQVARLVIYRDSLEAFHAEVVTALPDSSFSPEAGSLFQGLLLIEDWNGTLLYRLHSDGRNILINNPTREPSTIAAGLITETCYEITGYNYAADDPNNGETWTEDAGCTSNYYLGTPSSSFGLTAKSYLDIGGGGGGAPPSPAGMFTVISGNSPIANIADYNKCFTNMPGTDHTYQVTVCIDQPNPGTRDPWSAGGPSTAPNPVDVGHAFLVMTELTPFGTITRNVGFYPKGIVTPVSPSGPGQLNNNQNTLFNISLTITMTNSQFFQILNFVNQGNNLIYDLNSNNCTTWVLNALRIAGIDLPSTQGTWPGGAGNDPGDLGEDIRSMTLPSNMSRSNSYFGHQNQGTCI